MHRLLLLMALLSIPAWQAVAQTQGRAWVGVTVVDAPAADVPGDRDKDGGAIILGVEDGGPGSTARLQVLDRIVAVDAEPVASTRDLVCAMQARKPGDTVHFTLLRLGKRQTLAATLGRWPPLVRGRPPPPPLDCQNAISSNARRPDRPSRRGLDCKRACFTTMQVA